MKRLKVYNNANDEIVPNEKKSLLKLPVSWQYGLAFSISIILFMLSIAMTYSQFLIVKNDLDFLARVKGQYEVVTEIGEIQKAQRSTITEYIQYYNQELIQLYNEYHRNLNEKYKEMDSFSNEIEIEKISTRLYENDETVKNLFQEALLDAMSENDYERAFSLGVQVERLYDESESFIKVIKEVIKEREEVRLFKVEMQLNRTLWVLISAALLSTLIGISIMILVNRSVVKRLLDLVNVGNELSKGNFDIKPLTIHGNNELDQLSTVINKMSANLSHKITMINELNRDLEIKVLERTLTLSKTNDELNATLFSLKETQKQLVESEKIAALGHLVAGVAHEINTPIGTGYTAATYIQKEVKKFNEALKQNHVSRADFLKFMGDCGYSMDIIVSCLDTTIAIISAFKMLKIDDWAESRTTFYITEVLERVVLMNQTGFHERKVKYEILVDSNLKVRSYYHILIQVLDHLIKNALFHGFNIKKEGEIKIIATQKDQNLKLIVEDDGDGIDEAFLSSIFEPFSRRIVSTEHKGLGLTMIYNIVKSKLGGQIVCESKSGQYTRFILEFSNADDEVSL